jgi:hypothetical protein
MKDGIMAFVDAISSVDISADGVAHFGMSGEVFESGILVGGGVGAQNVVLVDVVCVSRRPTRVILREAEGVEVLEGGDHGVFGVVIAIDGWREDRLDQLAGDADGMVGLVVQISVDNAEDGGRHIGGLVEEVVLARDLSTLEAIAFSDGVARGSVEELREFLFGRALRCAFTRSVIGLKARIGWFYSSLRLGDTWIEV